MGRRAPARRYTSRELAKALGCHIRTVQRAMLRGDLKGYKAASGYYWAIPEEAVVSWLSTRETRRR